MENQENQENQPRPFDQADSDRTLALVVEGREFWVQREIMAAYSPVFKAMLYGDFAEAKKDSIELPGKKAADIEQVLLCLIPHPECNEIDQSNSDQVLAFADEYQVVELRRRAVAFWELALERCKKGDLHLVEILIISAKWHMNILEKCLNRCVEELNLESMVPIFNDVPDEVRTYLLLGGSGCRLKFFRNAQGKFCCNDWKKNDSYGYFKCTFCGKCGCSYCLDRSLTCGGKTKIEEMKKALLESMFLK